MVAEDHDGIGRLPVVIGADHTPHGGLHAQPRIKAATDELPAGDLRLTFHVHVELAQGGEGEDVRECLGVTAELLEGRVREG